METINSYLINREELPLVLEPKNKEMPLQELLELLQSEKGYFQKNLLRHGGILLRNFPINDIDAFSSIIDTLNFGGNLDYIGGDSPRDKIKGAVYTSTEAPPAIKIPLHNELSFVKHYPKHIYFYCGVAPEKNGETIIADARAVLRSMDKKVINDLNQKSIRYTSAYYGNSRMMDLLNKYQRSHKPWRDVFETTDPREAEEKCRQAGFDYRWHKDWMQISQTRPATLTHPETGEEAWFNQAHLYDFNPKLLGLWRYVAAKAFYCRPYTRLHEVCYGDGSPIPRSHLYTIMETLDQNTIYFPWKKGDVLILDNILAMHGRATFQGPRRIYAAMTG